ncbi:kyphoscoliosis peptidase-like [Spea bombifrons]|uniref:kyphoscoliosis peptidase-like n=1 Tax=Spea bombifrons TaxID=233779 RepID=UPI002349468E|nr:kyphoscoliosis peptidase-like [Spea bombifrons]
MALHERFSLWQRILLGIFCFPLLPFYLCVYCLCLKQNDKQIEAENVEYCQQENRLHNDEEENKEENCDSMGRDRLEIHIQKDDNVEHHQLTMKKSEQAQTGDPKIHGEEDKNGKMATTFKYPWDRKNLKSLQLDLKAFAKLDAYSSKVYINGTLECFVKDLLRNASTDLQKTRSIWTWICHHIEYDTGVLKTKTQLPCDPENVFYTRKAISTGYSSLFQRMCSIAGVQCKSVNGYSKGTGYKIGQKISEGPDHSWNMVYLEGGWHLLDSTWGAGYVEDTVGKFTFQYNEFYFLTHPALFIEDHFPDEADCQLLDNHLSLKHFEQSVHRRSHFYTLGLLSSQPETAVVETVKGKVSITIESSHHMIFLFHLTETEESGFMHCVDHKTMFELYPQKTGQHVLQVFSRVPNSTEAYHMVLDYRIDCKSVSATLKIPRGLINPVGPSWMSEKAGLLKPSQPNPMIHTENGYCSLSFKLDRIIKFTVSLKSDDMKTVHNHVIQSIQKSKVEFEVYLPQAGVYVLQIFGESIGYICNYLLICSNPNLKRSPFPALLQNPVGPNTDTEKSGLLQPSHPDPIIHTEDGCCTVSFSLDRVQKLTAFLKSDELHAVLDHIIQKIQKDKIEFNIRLPQAGSYVLQIFSDSVGYICNYLLTCSDHNVKWPPFPHFLHNPVGPSLETENMGLLQPSHPDPVINMEDGCCIVSFVLDRMLMLTVSLKSDEMLTIPNHVLQCMQKNKVEFKVRLPRAGSYVLQIFDGCSCCICNYLLTCSNTNVNWPPYPSGLHNPVGPNPGTEKAGLLQPSHPDPIINTQDGSCVISFAVKRDIHFFCTLISDDAQMKSEVKYRHVFQTQKEDKMEFNVRLAQSGTYVLRISFKTKISKVYSSQCNYLIICSNPDVHWPVFPLVFEDWAEHYELVEPLEGVLPKNSNVLFKLKVPGVAALFVKGKESFPLTINDQGYWEGTCSTEDNKELYVTARHKEQPNTWAYLLHYQVQ